jgi:Fur family ferric uptake transcriptional regulator
MVAQMDDRCSTEHKKPMERENAIRLNRGCSLVLRTLKECNGLCTAREIHAKLRADFDDVAPGLTTVYRALETLLKLELVQAVDLGAGEKSYEFVEPGEHHHHLVCTACNASVHLDQCLVETMSNKILERHGFTVRSHILDFFGLCPTCQAKDSGLS